MTKEPADSEAYIARKRAMRKQLTIYGRNPVQEAMSDASLTVTRLHLADSNRRAAVIDKLISAAEERHIPISYHDRKALSRISRNAKQDQGVAADLSLPSMRWLDELSTDEACQNSSRYLLCDGINNPQNLGMIIRSAAAAGISGLIIPDKGNASLSPLVIKASAGTVFRCPILLAEDVGSAVDCLKGLGVNLYTLDSGGEKSLLDGAPAGACAFVLGNETDGPSAVSKAHCSGSLHIPMHNGVESLNVAVTAALVAYLTH